MKTTFSALLLALALALAAPTGAQAIVPPKDCGTIKVGSKQHRIKADGVPCRFAKRKGARFLRSGKRPGKGWSCRRYPKSSGFSFRCEKGQRKNIYGIKR